VVVSRDHYRDVAVEFALAVRTFYGAPGDKRIVEDWERPLFDAFWEDFERLFALHLRHG
jgi:hypothetical protein